MNELIQNAQPEYKSRLTSFPTNLFYPWSDRANPQLVNSSGLVSYLVGRWAFVMSASGAVSGIRLGSVKDSFPDQESELAAVRGCTQKIPKQHFDS
jgi:hypothetical protein